jgi:hypothetical protein
MSSNEELSNDSNGNSPLDGQIHVEEALRLYKISKNICRTDGCNSKAQRIAKRTYANNCFKHRPVYYAQNSNSIIGMKLGEIEGMRLPEIK